MSEMLNNKMIRQLAKKIKELEEKLKNKEEIINNLGKMPIDPQFLIEPFRENKLQVHKIKNEIKIFSSDGPVKLDSFCLKELKRLSDKDYIIEVFENSGNLEISDILYFENSLFSLPLLERKKSLALLNLSKTPRIKSILSIPAKNLNEIKIFLEDLKWENYNIRNASSFYDEENSSFCLLKDSQKEIEWSSEKLNAAKLPKNWAVMVSHFRGKSVHLDFRRKINGHLEVTTILNAPEGLITEDVDTIEKAEKWNVKLLKEGKFRPNMDPDEKVLILPKVKRSLEWIEITRNLFPPESPGATKFEPGIYLLMDEGFAYPGTQKPHFNEFFLDMKHFKGRMVERAIAVGPEWETKPEDSLQWMAWLTGHEEQVPYLLTPRGREKADAIPPEGVSWLPPEWEEKVPEEFRWWKKKLTEKEKLKMIDDAYNQMFEKEKGDAEGKEERKN